MTAAVMIAQRVTYRGHVQGVGFRYTVLRLAQAYPAVTGCVRNQRDGSVEVFAQGPASAVQAFLDDIARGPHAEHIDEILRDDAAVSERYTAFRIAF